MPETRDLRPAALLVTRNFPPLLGGMENVNLRLLQELGKEWQVALCGPRGCGAHAPEATMVRESVVKPLPRFLLGTAIRAVTMALELRPRLVMAGSGLSAPMAWVAARLCGARLAVYLHGLDVIAPSRIYQWFWLPFIRACDVVLVNSRNTARLAAARGVDERRIHVLHPGTDIPALDAAAGAEFRRKFDLADGPILLSVGRLTRRKGLAEFVAHALPAIRIRHPDVVLAIIGEEAVNALHTGVGSERNRINAAALKAGVAEGVKFIGRCDEQMLSAAYQAAQVHVFPVLDQTTDVEGFGMVALESAAHGLRTVSFAVGGVPDAIDESCSGALVAAGEYGQFAEAVGTIIADVQSTEGVDACRDFARKKDWRAFGERLRNLLRPVGDE